MERSLGVPRKDGVSNTWRMETHTDRGGCSGGEVAVEGKSQPEVLLGLGGGARAAQGDKWNA